MCQRKDHRRSMLTLVIPSDSCDGFWMRRNLNKISCKTVIKTLILARPWHRNAWTYKSKSMQLWSLENVCKKQMKSMTNQFKMRARSRPKGGQGVQNEPRGVPEASRKPPKVTKTLQGGRWGRFSRVLQLKMGAQRHPRGGQGVENLPRGIPEASKRHLRASSNKYTNTLLEQVLKMCARMYPKACQNPWNIKWK